MSNTVSYFFEGAEFTFVVADVYDCQRFFGCSFEDALHHLAYAEASRED